MMTTIAAMFGGIRRRSADVRTGSGSEIRKPSMMPWFAAARCWRSSRRPWFVFIWTIYRTRCRVGCAPTTWAHEGQGWKFEAGRGV